MQMILGRIRGYSERPVDRLECIPDPAAQHLRCGKQAKRDFVLRVSAERAGDDVGRLVKAPGAQQQLAGMQPVLPIAGRERQGAQRESDGVFGLLEGQFEARHVPEDSAAAGRDDRSAHQVVERILVSARSLAEAGGVDGEFKRIRIEFARSAGMQNCAIELSGGGKRATRVTVPFGPSGTDVQQPLVCRRSVLVTPGIAEYPCTEIGYFFLSRPQLEGDVRAFGGMVAPTPVQQGFAEPAKENREFVLGNFTLSEIDPAGLDEIGRGAQWSGVTYRRFTNFIEIGHCTMFSGSCAVYQK